MILKPGDIFCVTYDPAKDEEGPSLLQTVLSFGIQGIETFNDIDGKAQMTHCGMIVSPVGKTFEALWTYRSQNIYQAYGGQPILIGRHRKMSQAKAHMACYYANERFGGEKYPAWKLPLFAIAPRLIKYLPGKPVCSELVFWSLCRVGLIDHWKGVTPSYVADAIRRWREFQVVYEGIMPRNK